MRAERRLEVFGGMPLPLDAATQAWAWLGRRGSGKTYGTGRFVEELVRAAVQVVVLDSVGNWFGLRLARDGKSPGLDVVVLGGKHGDLPLAAESAGLVADVLVETGRSMVLDVSQFSKGERKRFATALGERLWQRKKASEHAHVMHLVLEEAQLIVPQRIDRDEARMFGVWEEIIRLGRNYGVGISMLSQRPQSVNKEVLTQAECVVAFQTNGVPEKKALREWLTTVGAEGHVDLLERLPALEVGQPFLWSPSWLRTFKQTHVLPKSTYDASATPRAGERRVKAQVEPLDLGALREQMEKATKAAQESDPRALRERIRHLEAVIGQLKRAKAPAEVKTREVHIFPVKTLERFAKAAVATEKAAQTLAQVVGEVRQAAQVVRPFVPGSTLAIDQRTPEGERLRQALFPQVAARVNERLARSPAPSVKPHHVKGAAEEDGVGAALGAGPMRMLSALGQRHPTPLTRRQLGIYAGYTSRAGTFRTYLGQLRRGGLVEQQGEQVLLTPAGTATHVPPEWQAPPTAEGVRTMWRGQLGAGPVKMLDALLAEPDLTRRELGERTGYEASAGTFRTYLGELRRRHLVDTHGDTVRIAPELVETA